MYAWEVELGLGLGLEKPPCYAFFIPQIIMLPVFSLIKPYFSFLVAVQILAICLLGPVNKALEFSLSADQMELLEYYLWSKSL